LTLYNEVYKRFLRKVTDFRISELFVNSPSDADDRLQGWLESAIIKFQRCKTNLSDRNDTSKQFNNTLSDYEKEILSVLMLVEWIEPEVNHILDMTRELSDTDFKIHSAKDNLEAKKKLLIKHQEDADRLIIAYGFDVSLLSGLQDLG